MAVTAERKKVEEHFKLPIQQAKDAVKDLQHAVKSHLAPLTAKEVALRQLVTTYHQAQAERRRKEQERLNKQHEKKIENAIAKGKDITEVAPPKMVETLAKTTQVQGGKVTFREVKKVVILDESKIPEVYWDKVLNKKRVEMAVKAGEYVPGTQLVIEKEVAVG